MRATLKEKVRRGKEEEKKQYRDQHEGHHDESDDKEDRRESHVVIIVRELKCGGQMKFDTDVFSQQEMHCVI